MINEEFRQFLLGIEIYADWHAQTREWLPKFISEAAKGLNWDKWDPEVFHMYFIQRSDHPVSNLNQGYFSGKELEEIKSHWDEIAPNLQTLALNQDAPNFELYQNLSDKILSHCKRWMYAATRRLIAGLQPKMLTSLVSDKHLENVCANLSKLFGFTFEGDYFQKSSRLMRLINETLSEKDPMDNITLPWQLYETFEEMENEKQKSTQAIETLKNSLLAYKNLILTGAPGTGKTHKAREIAAAIGATTENHRFGFAQFHPSYDYTDFVEGLRPVQDNNGNLGFERRDGIFMEFCSRALHEPDQPYVFVIDEINRGELSKIFGELFFSIDPGYRGLAGQLKTQYSNLWQPETFDGTGMFHIPENVYIIGTMNDIDRSVESMDFAMRRRFTFLNISAEQSAEILNAVNEWPKDTSRQELENKMTALNEVIAKTPGLGEPFQLGGAYFKRIEECSGYDDLWNKHLKGILWEYLRSMTDAKQILAEMEEAYVNGKTSDDAD